MRLNKNTARRAAAAAALLTMTAAMSVGAFAADDTVVEGYLPPQAESVMTQGDIALHSDVPVGEVDPKTMASKKTDGLYFAGELLDVDAYTGGFNLQIAWATGRAAGESAAERLQDGL